MKNALKKRELACILAALRTHQAVLEKQATVVFEDADQGRMIADIATDGGSVRPLGAVEIDHLCQRLNTSR